MINSLFNYTDIFDNIYKELKREYITTSIIPCRNGHQMINNNTIMSGRSFYYLCQYATVLKIRPGRFKVGKKDFHLTLLVNQDQVTVVFIPIKYLLASHIKLLDYDLIIDDKKVYTLVSMTSNPFQTYKQLPSTLRKEIEQENLRQLYQMMRQNKFREPFNNMWLQEKVSSIDASYLPLLFDNKHDGLYLCLYTMNLDPTNKDDIAIVLSYVNQARLCYESFLNERDC